MKLFFIILCLFFLFCCYASAESTTQSAETQLIPKTQDFVFDVPFLDDGVKSISPEPPSKYAQLAMIVVFFGGSVFAIVFSFFLWWRDENYFDH